jgi:hypothetical protein
MPMGGEMICCVTAGRAEDPRMQAKDTKIRHLRATNKREIDTESICVTFT